MIRILITDTHFGWKQNAIGWLESQIKFFDRELIPFIERQTEPVRLIHLGDVFESRSSISPLVAKAVRERFMKLNAMVEDFIIIAGNHDFYSPNSDDIDSITMVLRECGMHLVIKEPLVMDEDIFVPWYNYKTDDLERILKLNPEVKNIYTHADIFGEDRKFFPGKKIFSGHIHIPQIDTAKGWYNLGSCYSLNFADANHDRYFYTYDGNKVLAHANNHSIRFWRIKNEAIFDEVPQRHRNDYYELYIDQANMQTAEYQKRISELTQAFKNMVVIPLIPSTITEGEQFESYDVSQVCRSIIPERLQAKFALVERSLIKE